jgi:hemerythrin superfamily protein
MSVPKQRDLADAVAADHRAMTGLFEELEASGDARNRGQLAARVIEELVRHSVAEEQFLYPAVRAALPDGDEVADRAIAVHAGAEQLMKSLTRTDPTTPAFAEQVTTLLADMRRHFAEEEGELLPRLRATCDPGELRELGLRFEQAHRIAPTRPHPAAPDTPPANKIVDLGVGLIDRVRDAMTGRNK